MLLLRSATLSVLIIPHQLFILKSCLNEKKFHMMICMYLNYVLFSVVKLQFSEHLKHDINHVLTRLIDDIIDTRAQDHLFRYQINSVFILVTIE